MPRPVLDLLTARRWAVTARVMLAGARERIDALNVFPVADGDTGTNMYLTMDGALEFVRGQFELGAGTDRLDEGLALIARGMLLAARGNSGVILSQLTKGLSDAVGPDVEAAGPEDLAVAFETAARTAWDALAAPVEGTILTVARAAAEGAREAVDRGYPLYGDPSDELVVGDVVSEALSRAQQALAETPELLPALKVAGVVDAGGAGLVLVVEALEAVLEERPHLAVEELPTWWEVAPAPRTRPGPVCAVDQLSGETVHEEGEGASGQADRAGGAHGEEAGDGDVEVMFLLTDTDPTRADRLRLHLDRIGGSVVVAGGPTDYRVHVHLHDPRLAVEAGTFAGLVEDVRLTSLTDGSDLAHVLQQGWSGDGYPGPRLGGGSGSGLGQHSAAGSEDSLHRGEHGDHGQPGHHSQNNQNGQQGHHSQQGQNGQNSQNSQRGQRALGSTPRLAVVACGLGEGVHDLLSQAGAQVVPSGPRRRASAGQLLAAMWASGAPHVVVLPNDHDTVLVASAAAEEAAREGLDVHVVPSGTLVQGLAALAVLDPDGDPQQVVRAMTEAAAGCSPGALTRAERDADTPVGPCAVGQWLGIVDGAIVAVGDDLVPVAGEVLTRLLRDDAEVLTVVAGATARPEELAPVLSDLAARHTGMEVVQIEGGQPTYPYLLGVE